VWLTLDATTLNIWNSTTDTLWRTTAPSLPSAQQISKTLRAGLTPAASTAASISALVRHGGVQLTIELLEPGRLRTFWYARQNAARGAHQPDLRIAAATQTFARAGTNTIEIKLTAAGRHLLERAQHLRITSTTTFSPRILNRRIAISATFVVTR
jgi:hypothetical protein